MLYENFDLWIDNHSEGRYHLRAIIQGLGEAGSVLDLDPKCPEIHYSLERLAQRETDRSFLETFGTRLYHLLFNGEIESLFQQAYREIADRANQGIRLRLRIEPPELAVVPWELVYFPDEDCFLGTLLRCPVVRYVEMHRRIRELKVKLPLKILVVIPNIPAPYPQLDAQKEKEHLREALVELTDSVKVEFLEGLVTRTSVRDALKEFEPHCVHFIGHGDFSDDKGHVLLNGDDGQLDYIDEERFARQFHNHDAIKLVVLSSCKGAQASSIKPLIGMAPQLVKRGIPAVIAMQFSMDDRAAVLFAQEFYRRLFKGGNRGRVDLAMSCARELLAEDLPGERDLGAPVLFMRAWEGLLFDLPTNSQASKEPREELLEGVTRRSLITNGSFDVFLSHNSKDKPAARQLAKALQARGLRVWLDEEQLVPGRPWQEALEEIIETARTAAVLVGQDGLGPWEIPEMHACLSQFVKRRLPVIPVLLPDAPSEPKLPLFLQEFTWVDLRGGLTDEGLNRLVWGITYEKPEPSTRSAKDRLHPLVDRIRALINTIPLTREELDRIWALIKTLTQQQEAPDARPEETEQDREEERGLRQRIRLRNALVGTAGMIVVILFFPSWVKIFDYFRLDTMAESYAIGLGNLFSENAFSDRIVMVPINAETETALGKRFDRGWRQEHAVLVDELSRAGARVIAFDLYFQEQTDFDEAFAAAIERAKQRGTAVILGFREIQDGQPKLTRALAQAASDLGAVCVGEKLGRIRTVPIAIKTGSHAPFPSLFLAALVAARSGAPARIGQDGWESLHLAVSGGDTSGPMNLGFSELTVSTQYEEKCPAIGAGTVVADLYVLPSSLAALRDSQRRFPYESIISRKWTKESERFRDKIVIVGVEKEDESFEVFPLQGAKRFGFELHADALNTALNRVTIRSLAESVQLAIMTGLGLTGAFIRFWVPRSRPLWRAGLLLAFVTAYLITVLYVYHLYSLLLNTVYHLGTLVFSYWFAGKVEREWFSPR
jgi:CHASE2 domain-containing sensor protein